MQIFPIESFVAIRGARLHNLKNVSLEIPRHALVVFTGVSGSGKSSLAFGTLFAEAQRRYLESVSPYARRLFNQLEVPEVDEIEGLPPAIALQQQKGTASTRSSVGSVTTISNLLRMLYSRAGEYPAGQPIIYAEGFSPNTPQGACAKCHGIGKIYSVTEKSMVPDDALSIRQRAIAAWPSAWQGQNLREILMTLGYDVDTPWRALPKKDREWILFTEEQPTVPVYSGFSASEMKKARKKKLEPSYMGTFTSAQKYVMQTFANTQSQLMKKRVAKYMLSTECPECKGKRLKKEALGVKFLDKDISEMSKLNLSVLYDLYSTFLTDKKRESNMALDFYDEKAKVAIRIAEDLCSRLSVLLDLGLGYLSPDRLTPTLSPGELQRLRLATQIRSNLFGVVYVLDEPSAGLHPSDTQALLRALDKLKAAGNSLFVVEHEIDVIRHADWIVDVGPAAGKNGGEIVYSGPLRDFHKSSDSVTSRYLNSGSQSFRKQRRELTAVLELKNLSANNIKKINVAFPLHAMVCVTGVSGSGKSTLVSHLLVNLMQAEFGQKKKTDEDDFHDGPLSSQIKWYGKIAQGADAVKRLVVVDQKPIGRTPRSNLATYTGLFDSVRKIYTATPAAKSKGFDAGRFSFNSAKGQCPHCEGEGFVMVELLFLPSVYSPCPLCHGTRYNVKTLEITFNEKNIAEVLQMTVDEARDFFQEHTALSHAFEVLQQVGLGYLRLGQPATELSGGEAQRIKLATELQKAGKGNTLYILDEPTTGLHPSDVEKLLTQLQQLVDRGNSVVLVEHDLQVMASSDWIIDLGPGGGDAGGKIIFEGRPEELCQSNVSATAPFLWSYMVS